MWRYEQTTGKLLDAKGIMVATGYAGKGDGKNNHLMQDVHNVGPIPCGFYTMQSPHNSPKHGPFCIALAPDPENIMFGRSAFLIHGDKIGAPGTASEGCIIMPRMVREAMWYSKDHRLEVVE